MAKQQLLTIPAQVASTEQISAWGLLLDEYYFWPGHYQRYLQLADSLHITTVFYSTARLFAQQPSAQHRMQVDSFILPIRLKGSLPVVDVQINGRSCRLILDTGAQRTFISHRFGSQSGLKKLTDLSVINYIGQSVSGSLMMADSLVLGGLTVKDLPVIEAQIPFLGIDGLLGWDILRQFMFKIDYANRRLTLCRSIPKPVQRTNLLGGSRPMLLMHGPNNNQLNVLLDTGANNEFSISPTGSTKVGPFHTKSRLTFSQNVGQFIHISRERFVKQLSIQIDTKSYSFKNSAIFRDDNIIGLVIRDGLIGSRAFRKGSLILDGPNHWFSYQQNLIKNQ